MTAFKRRLIWIVIGVALLALALLALRPVPVEADMGRVTRGPLVESVDEDGRTRIKDRYVVAAPVSGRLLRVELDEGDPVIAGRTVLASIEPAEPRLQDPRDFAETTARILAAETALERARAERERARAAEILALKERERIAGLHEEGVTSPQERDRAEYEATAASESVRVADRTVQIANYELELARAARIRPGSGSPDAGPFDLRSPVDGRVLRVLQESSAVVVAGAPVLEIGDSEDLEIAVDVLSQDAVRIRPGDLVVLEHWGGERPLEARIRVVEPSAFTKISALGVEEQRVWVVADLQSSAAERARLGDGYRVEARIIVWQAEDVLQVPVGALFRLPDEGWAVFVHRAGRAELRSVERGHANGLFAQITDGLEEGDEVILHPGERVGDGVRVTPRGQ
jgi:HlyD family secretion protein